MVNKLVLSALFLLSFITVFSQEQQQEGRLTGNFQADIQFYNKDSAIGAPVVPEKALFNSFANFNYTKGNFSAGFRYEGYLNTLQGFPNQGGKNNGIGIPIRFATYKADELEITAGNFYEQYGSGIILRSYEDKGLGYDNAFDGIKLKYEPTKGINIKGMFGQQRLYFAKGPGIVRGIDGEINMNEAIPFFANYQGQLIIGGSFVSKYQKDSDPIYILPENVAAGAGRINFSRGKISFNGEYSMKINDPSSDNNFIYKQGEALLVNASYSAKGIGVLISGKRIDNMSFRSDRNENLNNLNINYLPAITKATTYSLLAMYPYATQPNGELGGSIDVMYKFKKESLLGGKYGTDISINFSRVNALRKIKFNDTIPVNKSGTDGYYAPWFDAGKEIYYQDFNIEVNKKLSDKIKFSCIYQYLIYNYDVVRGVSEHGMVYANTGVLDFSYKVRSNKTIRAEVQGLFTKQDMQSWAMGLIEFTTPSWFVTVYDQYNFGNTEKNKRFHYFTVSCGYTKKSNRIQLSYGKQKEGIMCVGGVCRAVPASNGFALSVSSTF